MNLTITKIKFDFLNVKKVINKRNRNFMQRKHT